MERKLDTLVEVLEQTKALYEQMLTLVQDEKAAATASDFERFSRISAEKENLVARLRKMDQRRTALLHTLATTFDIPIEQLTISKLTARVETPYRVKLNDMASSLEKVISEVRVANRECCLIIEHCLGLVTRSLGFFQHWMQSSTVYGHTGAIDAGNRSGGRMVSDMA